MKIFGREPAWWIGILAAILMFASNWLPLTNDQQSIIIAVVNAVFGLVTAWAVSAEKALPAVVGLVQAVFALFLGFGLDVPANLQTGIMALITAISAGYVRTQVVAPVSAAGLRRSLDSVGS